MPKKLIFQTLSCQDNSQRFLTLSITIGNWRLFPFGCLFFINTEEEFILNSYLLGPGPVNRDVIRVLCGSLMPLYLFFLPQDTGLQKKRMCSGLCRVFKCSLWGPGTNITSGGAMERKVYRMKIKGKEDAQKENHIQMSKHWTTLLQQQIK